MTSLDAAIDLRTEEQAAGALELLKELISVNSVNPSYPGVKGSEVLGGETECNEVLASWFEAAGLHCDWVAIDPVRRNLVATRSGGGEGPSLLLNGHVDTVPPVNKDSWITESPWLPKVDGSQVFGLGAADMKAGLVVMWLVAQTLDDCGIDLGGDIRFHSVVGEEMGEHDLGTSACLTSAGGADAALVLEPSGVASRPRLATACAGNLYLRLTLRGKSTHAGNRALAIRPGGLGDAIGVNAVELGVHVVTALLELERQWGITKHDERFPNGFFSILPGVFHSDAGYPAPLYFADHAIIECLIWYPPREDVSNIQSEVENYLIDSCSTHPWLRDNPPEVEWINHWPPMETNDTVQFAQEFAAGIADVSSLYGGVLEPTMGHFGASCDGSYLQRAGIPALVFGPGDLVDCHAVNEHVDVDEIVAVSRAVLRGAVRWCGV